MDWEGKMAFQGTHESLQSRAARVQTATPVQKQKARKKARAQGRLTGMTRTPCPVTLAWALTPLGSNNKVPSAEHSETSAKGSWNAQEGKVQPSKVTKPLRYHCQKVPPAPYPHRKQSRKLRPNGNLSAMIRAKDSKHKYRQTHTHTQ